MLQTRNVSSYFVADNNMVILVLVIKTLLIFGLSARLVKLKFLDKGFANDFSIKD